MDLSEDLRAAWLAAGWKRGAFVRLQSNPHLLGELPRKLCDFVADKESVCIVPILYECALIDESFEKEPWAQVLVIWRTNYNGSYAFGKNPRRLHLRAKDGEQELCFEIAAISFSQVDRVSLLKATPDTSLSWEDGELALMLDWVAERYRQSTFPDAFNKRLEPSKKALEKLWKSENFCSYSSGVYFNLDTFDELQDEILYNVKVIITIPYIFKGREYISIDRDRAPDMISRLKAVLDAVKNIEILSVDTLSEREFTKEIERDFLKFSLEYYSYKADPAMSPLPAEYLSS